MCVCMCVSLPSSLSRIPKGGISEDLASCLFQILGGFLPARENALRAAESTTRYQRLRAERTPEIRQLGDPVVTLQQGTHIHTPRA